MTLRPELDVDVLPSEADLPVDDELPILEEVRDLELRLRLHDLALVGLEGLEAGVRVDDVAEDDPVELHPRAGVEPRILDDLDLDALLPLVELPRTPDRPDVLPPRAAFDVVRGVGEDPPRGAEVPRGDGLAVAPPRTRLVREADGERTPIDDPRPGCAEPPHEVTLVVADLAAVPDVVDHKGCRIQIVALPGALKVRRLLVVDKDDRPCGRPLGPGRLRRGRGADDEARGEREDPDKGQQ